MYLTVTSPFYPYNLGDTITDNNKIAGIIGSPNVVNVLFVADSGAVTDILASRGLTPMAPLPNLFTGSLALGTGTSSFVEMVGSGYARQSISFGPLVGGKATNAASTPFAATGAWSQATQYGLFDASNNLLAWWANGAPFTLSNGQTSPIAQCAFISSFPDVAAAVGRSALIYAAGTVVGSVGSANMIAGVSIQVSSGVLSAPSIGLVTLGLPTTLPSTPGVLWLNGGVLGIS